MDIVTTLREPFAPDVEFVERKGPGHPDTLCDALAERMGIRIARHFLAATGEHRHFNVDKALLAAGAVEVGFGGGRTTRPSRLILAGKADLREAAPEPEALAAAARADLEEILPGSGDAFELEVWLNPSSADLLPVLSGRGGRVPLANDTSFAVVTRPHSRLERTVLAVSAEIDRRSTSGQLPVGRDVKVMASRRGRRNTLVIAAAMRAGGIPDRAGYDEAVHALATIAREVVAPIVGGLAPVSVNQGDRAGMPYLTLTGTSAEAGDDGQVGRGNRFGGLITPHRPMSLEAICGKNPVGHVGKTYHAVAWDIAGALLEAGAGEATVRILSRIGNPITEPELVQVETVEAVEEALVEKVVRVCLDDWEGVARRFLEGTYPVV